MEQNPRRDFLKSGALILGAPAVLSALQGSKSIKVGLVGCGGRGTGAASQALKADDFANLTVMADVFQERIDESVDRLKKIHGDKVKVEKANMFVGLDA
ncbi:MAG: oxidoreductase, partial [Acidobacteriia bacterium 12-62-4]